MSNAYETEGISYLFQEVDNLATSGDRCADVILRIDRHSQRSSSSAMPRPAGRMKFLLQLRKDWLLLSNPVMPAAPSTALQPWRFRKWAA
jgi:hypothetical protein